MKLLKNHGLSRRVGQFAQVQHNSQISFGVVQRDADCFYLMQHAEDSHIIQMGETITFYRHCRRAKGGVRKQPDTYIACPELVPYHRLPRMYHDTGLQ